MDPLVILAARPGAALFVNCRSGTFRAVPADPDHFAFVLADSGVRRDLRDGRYNRRREECEEAVRRLRAGGMELFTLRDLEPADLPRVAGVLPERLFCRVRHVVTENDRVRAAADALAGNDAGALGSLLDASHDSLRDDFEVSCPELDTLVSIVRGVPGVLGCRMTGAGFGGMVAAAVRPSAVNGLCAAWPVGSTPRVVVPGAPAAVFS
jgi:galactokinase